MPKVLKSIDKAVTRMAEVEPELANLVTDRFGYGVNLEALGTMYPNKKTNERRHRDTIAKEISRGVGWIACYLHFDDDAHSSKFYW